MASKSEKGQDPDYDGGKRWPERGGNTSWSDPNAPKRPLSAFVCFINEERPMAMAKYPDYTVGQIMKKLCESWETCPNKSKFEALAAKEKERYEAEMAEYIRKQSSSNDDEDDEEEINEEKMASNYKKGQDPDYDGGKRWPERGGNTSWTDPNPPKRPKSAFLLFANEERPAVKAMYPDCNLGQMAKKLGDSWKTCPNRSKFEALAAKDQERYEVEMAEYRRKENDSDAIDAIAKRDPAKAGEAATATKEGSKSKPPAKKAKVDDDEDNDDEEESNEEKKEEEEEKSN